MSNTDDFINMIAPIAREQAKKHDWKIYPSVCIAQAAKESGWGTSAKMVKANALYGIKVGQSAYHFGKAWKDKAYKTGTTEIYNGNAKKIQDWFRAYDNLSDATEDYFDLLCTAKRYKAAVNAPDYKACIRAIAPSYATAESLNHGYSKSVISIIQKYHLDRYDVKGDMPQTDKSIDDIAREVIAGMWGNGAIRKQRLRAAGWNPAIIQARVNEMLKG